MLNGAHLGGLIDDVVLQVSGGVATIEAADKKSTLLMSISTEVDIADGCYGISEIPKLLKVYSTGDVKTVLTPKALTVRGKCGRATSPLSDPDMIVSLVSLETEHDNLVEYMDSEFDEPVEFVLTGDAYNSAKKWLNAAAKDYMVFKVGKDKVRLTSPKAQTFSYNIPVAEIDSKESFGVQVNYKSFTAIAKTIDWDIDVVNIRLEEGMPVHIQQGTSHWYLRPQGE